MRIVEQAFAPVDDGERLVGGDLVVGVTVELSEVREFEGDEGVEEMG